ncbi:hypothetical protein Tco_0639986, partial [Tanacetum coccineum]
CYEKVVRIPLEGDEILRVHRERTLGAAKALMNAKVDEHRISDIPVARDITDVFPKDLLRLSPQRQVEFRIDLVPGATPVAKSPYRLAPSEMKEFYTRRFQDVKLVRIYIDEIIARKCNSGDDQLRLRWMIYLVVLADVAESTLEDIMRACVVDFSGSYQLSIRCALFEALYGRKCRSPVLWAEIGESSLIGPELVQEMTDKLVLVKEKPKALRDRQKSYVDYRHKPLEFKVGDRPFEILERIGLVAYRLRLHEELSSVHDTFHVSNLKKCLVDANLHVPLDEIKVDKTLHFVEEPVEIMDREIRKLKHRKVVLMKVRWNSKHGLEFTWEHEDQMRIKYQQLFVDRVVEPVS